MKGRWGWGRGRVGERKLGSGTKGGGEKDSYFGGGGGGGIKGKKDYYGRGMIRGKGGQREWKEVCKKRSRRIGEGTREREINIL
jgi:hypothetical protein